MSRVFKFGVCVSRRAALASVAVILATALLGCRGGSAVPLSGDSTRDALPFQKFRTRNKHAQRNTIYRSRVFNHPLEVHNHFNIARSYDQETSGPHARTILDVRVCLTDAANSPRLRAYRDFGDRKIKEATATITADDAGSVAVVFYAGAGEIVLLEPTEEPCE